MCYTDSQMVLDLCNTMVSSKHHYEALLCDIKDLLMRDWKVMLLHTLHEANNSADKLAKLETCQPEKMKLLEVPSVALGMSLMVEAMRVPQMRG